MTRRPASFEELGRLLEGLPVESLVQRGRTYATFNCPRDHRELYCVLRESGLAVLSRPWLGLYSTGRVEFTVDWSGDLDCWTWQAAERERVTLGGAS